MRKYISREGTSTLATRMYMRIHMHVSKNKKEITYLKFYLRMLVLDTKNPVAPSFIYKFSFSILWTSVAKIFSIS